MLPVMGHCLGCPYPIQVWGGVSGSSEELWLILCESKGKITRREITRQRKHFKIAAGTVNCTGKFKVIAVEVRLLSAASVASESLQMLSLPSCSRLYLGFYHLSQIWSEVLGKFFGTGDGDRCTVNVQKLCVI